VLLAAPVRGQAVYVAGQRAVVLLLTAVVGVHAGELPAVEAQALVRALPVAVVLVLVLLAPHVRLAGEAPPELSCSRDFSPRTLAE
jgi:choline-glycine betaine transporter